MSGHWVDSLVDKVNEQRSYDNSLKREHDMSLLPEIVPASKIALHIAWELRDRGLDQLPQDVLQKLILVVLEENDYRIVRRNPPPLPPEPTQEPVTMHGDTSVVEIETVLEDNRQHYGAILALGDQPGWVYYLRVADKIKIGFSSQPTKRLKAYPPESELLAIHPGTKDLERQLHKQFVHALTDGREWFAPNLALDEHIDTVLIQFGPPPDHFKPKYRKHTTTTVRPKYWSGK